MGFLEEVVVESAIWLLWAILTYVDVVLVVILGVLEKIRPKTPPHQSNEDDDVVRASSAAAVSSKKRAHVVIVGASFAGMAAHNELSHCDDDVDLTLIDWKSYFEYTPGVLRCFVEPSHYHDALTVPLSQISQRSKTTRVIIDEVVELKKTNNKVVLKSRGEMDYDYLLLATGSSYDGLQVIKATRQTMIHQRQDQWNQAHLNLDLARSVIIVGAGAVGVELAGEIVTEYPQKKVYLVDGATSILTGFPLSIDYATKWLQSRGVELVLGSKPKEIHDQSVVLEGRTIEADLVYKCFGAAPCMDLVKDKNAITNKGLLVNQHLQLIDSSNVFCAGDVCNMAAATKLGFTAEVNAHLAVRNIMECIRQGKTKTNTPHNLFVYPQDIIGAPVLPFVYDISLGKYDGTLGFNSLVLNGPFTAIMKWMIEWTKVAAASQRPVGLLFWFLADNITFILGRTLLPPCNPRDSSHDKRKNQ